MIEVKLEASVSGVGMRLTLDDQDIILNADTIGNCDDELHLVMNWLTQWLVGHRLKEAQWLAPAALLQLHPTSTVENARLVEAVMREAVYRRYPRVEVEDTLVCRCHKVFRRDLLAVIHAHPQWKPEELSAYTKAGSGCGQCITELQGLITAAQGDKRRWQGKAHSEWVLEIQEALSHWSRRHLNWPSLEVISFQQGALKLRVQGELTADQEWELTQLVGDFLSEGFPAGLAVFLDFSLRQD